MLSTLTILGQASILLMVLAPWRRFIRKNVLLLCFLVACVATSGSLFYSDIAGFDPCKLCWIQRIFMYPQVILLGMALIKKDLNILPYSLALSIPGALLALYHYLLQLNIVTGAPCSVVGYSASCSKVFVMNFGYITIPLMAFIAFAMIVMFILSRGASKKQ